MAGRLKIVDLDDCGCGCANYTEAEQLRDRAAISELLDDTHAILLLDRTDDNYQTIPIDCALRILKIMARKLNQAVEIGERVAACSTAFHDPLSQ